MAPKATGESKKRKEAPTNASTKSSSKRPRNDHRAKQREARILAAQTSSKAFKHGQLDVEGFVKAREYEIRALEDGMAKSKQVLTKRAFQQVPKDLRRRTASHNAKRVPKRLQQRAKREMVEDNTPTVSARRRKPTRHMRLRLETLKKLRALGSQQRAHKESNGASKPDAGSEKKTALAAPPEQGAIKTRTPRVKTAQPATPPLPKAKFRNRQLNKTWLPTHIFHAKRARMTQPKQPLWRFAIPMTPTAKSYRTTHRAAHERGAIAWDTSYFSTIGFEGIQKSLEGIFKTLGVGSQPDDAELWSHKGGSWRDGSRAWEGFVFEREPPHRPIAPITIIWSSLEAASERSERATDTSRRRAFLRVHPAAFSHLWPECVRLAKVAKPQASIEDLRFEIGSIEVSGPNATEALLGALRPVVPRPETEELLIHRVWTSLAGLTDPAVLPPDVVLGFEIEDPRLYHPPRTVKLAESAEERQALIELTATWPLRGPHVSPSLFDRRMRSAACSALLTQKSINRRKGEAMPGEYPISLPNDPRIPALVFASPLGKRSASSWTVLLPWKCVQPVWYSLMYYPLSSGGQPHFGGLDEKRQVLFEACLPWFPGDYPGTKAGLEWELQERQKRKDEWARRPKSKRVKWAAVLIGNAKPGEVGDGWSCDWERLLSGKSSPNDPVLAKNSSSVNESQCPNSTSASQIVQQDDVPVADRPALAHVPRATAKKALEASMGIDTSAGQDGGDLIINVSLSSVTRGVPQTCARIYRLPSISASAELRSKWLALHPRDSIKQMGSKNSLPKLPKDAPAHVVQRTLARSLLEPPQAGHSDYPACPSEEDLIGFVTTGNLNLSEGRGTAIGNILLDKVAQDVRENGEDGKLCIIRNSGNSVGRLAKWQMI